MILYCAVKPHESYREAPFLAGSCDPTAQTCDGVTTNLSCHLPWWKNSSVTFSLHCLLSSQVRQGLQMSAHFKAIWRVNKQRQDTSGIPPVPAAGYLAFCEERSHPPLAPPSQVPCSNPIQNALPERSDLAILSEQRGNATKPRRCRGTTDHTCASAGSALNADKEASA